MSNIRYYAPTGTTEITLSSGTKLAVNSSGYVTADASFAPELQRAGFTAGTEDSVQAVTGPNGEVSLYGATSCEATGASTTSTPAQNYAAIQKALNAGGYVTLLTPGIFEISTPLIQYSNTHFKLGQNTILKMVTGGAANNIIRTKTCDDVMNGLTTTVTLTWVSGRNVTVNWPAHGLSEGDFALVYGSTPSTFSGVFQVLSVTDADHLVVKLHKTPTTGPTGTIKATKATSNWSIKGGVWDYNYPANTITTNAYRHAIMAVGAAHFEVAPKAIKKVLKFGVYLNGVFDFRVHGFIGANTLSDGVKVYGPAKHGIVHDISGRFGDDVVSAQTKEPAAYIANQLITGDVIGVTIEHIDATSSAGSGIVAVYPSDTEYMGRVVVDDISGTMEGTGGGVSIVCTMASTVLDDVSIENVSVAATQMIKINAIAGTATANQIKIKSPKVTVADYSSISNGVMLLTDSAWTIGQMNIQDMDAVNSAITTASLYLIQIGAAGNQLNFIGGNANLGANNVSIATVPGAWENITIQGVRTGSSLGTFLYAQAGTPNITVNGCNVNSYGFVSLSVAATVELSGNRVNVGGNGLIRLNNTMTSKILSSGNNRVAGSIITFGSGTPTALLYGNDLAVDITAAGFSKTTSGQFCFNTAAAAGTIAQNRLVTCNGTNWIQVDDSTKLY